MSPAKECQVCAEKKSNYFSIFDKVIGKNLSTVIENISGIKICPVTSRNTVLICESCAVSVIHAETVVQKLHRSLSNLSIKKVIKENIKIQEQDNPQQQNAKTIQAPTVWHFKCDHCSYESSNVKWFRKHLANKHQIETARIYKCNQCSESYKVLYRLKSHIKLVHEDKTSTTSCRPNSTSLLEITTFTNEKDSDSESDKGNGSQQAEVTKECNFDKQIKDISIDNLHFQCDSCSYNSDNAKLFKKHLVNVHQVDKPRIFKCSQCNETYQLLHGLQSHIKYVHENVPRPPRRRNSVFPSEIKNSVSHEKDDADSPSTKCMNSENLLQSFVEDMEKENNKEIMKGKTVVSNNVKSKGEWHFKCDHCPYETDTAKFFKTHLTTEHQIEKPRIFKCDQCSESYQLLHGLQSHVRDVHENMPLPLTSVASQKDMTNKNQSQSFLKNFEYENDGLTTDQSENKSDSKPNDIHVNEINMDTFQTNPENSFEATNKVNSKGVWYFKCDHCPYETDTAKLFKKHLTNEHQIEKPRIFKCNQCPETYQLLYGLKYHIKRVHEDKSKNVSTDYIKFKLPVSKKNKSHNSTLSQENTVKNMETYMESEVTEKKKLSIKRKKSIATEYTNNETLATDKQENCVENMETYMDSDKSEVTEKKKLSIKRKKSIGTEYTNNETLATDKQENCVENMETYLDSNKSEVTEKKKLSIKRKKSIATEYTNNETLATDEQENTVENMETYMDSDKSEVTEKKKLSIKRKKSIATEYTNNETLATDEQEISLPKLRKAKFMDRSEQLTLTANAHRSESEKSDSENDNRDNQNVYTPKKTSKNVSFSTVLYECNDCPYNSDNAKHFKKHQMSKHQIDNSSIHTDSDNTKYPYNLVSSVKKRIQSKPHTCVVCGKSFALIDELRLHMQKSHLGEVVRDCPHCGARFRSEQKYDAHVFSEKCLTAKYSCQYPNCNKRFNKSFKLHKHMQEKHPDEQITE